MSTRTFGRRARILLTALLLPLLAAVTSSCGGGGGHFHHHFEGTLQVCNDPASFFFIVEIDVTPFDGGFTEVFPTDLDAGDCDFIDLFPDTYIVDVFYEDNTAQTATVNVFDDTTTIVTFEH